MMKLIVLSGETWNHLPKRIQEHLIQSKEFPMMMIGKQVIVKVPETMLEKFQEYLQSVLAMSAI